MTIPEQIAALQKAASDDLIAQYTELHGKGKVLKLDMAMRKAHPSDQRGYLKALTLKLEELTSEQPTELVDLAAARRRRR